MSIESWLERIQDRAEEKDKEWAGKMEDFEFAIQLNVKLHRSFRQLQDIQRKQNGQ